MRPLQKHCTSLAAKACRGFTLVELLVVIGIIALLISILLPALNRARSSAVALKCQANLRTIGQAIRMYAADNKDVMPYGYWDGGVPPGSGFVGSRASNWGGLLMATLSSRYGATADEAYASGTNTARLREALFCPELGSVDTNQAEMSVIHYLSHPRLMPDLSVNDNYAINRQGAPANTKLKPYKVSKVKRSSEIALIFDGTLIQDTDGTWRPSDRVPVAVGLDAYRINYESFLTDDYHSGLPSYVNPGNPIDMTPQPSGDASLLNLDIAGNRSNFRFRHMNNTIANLLFVDGHVEPHTMKDRFNSSITRGNINVNP